MAPPPIGAAMGLGLQKPPLSPPVSPVEVTLNVYDLGTSSTVRTINRMLRGLGSGAFHCGVEVCGHEWSYGHCGIFSSPPRACMGHSYSESVPMGISFVAEREVLLLVRHLERDWPGRRYDIVTHNCCQFSDAFCQQLGVGCIPPWVTRLASAGVAFGGLSESLKLGSCCCGDSSGRPVYEESVEKSHRGARVVAAGNSELDERDGKSWASMSAAARQGVATHGMLLQSKHKGAYGLALVGSSAARLC